MCVRNKHALYVKFVLNTIYIKYLFQFSYYLCGVKTNKTMMTSKFLRIDCDVYKRGIVVFVGRLSDMQAWVVENYPYDDEKEFVEMVVNLKDTGIVAASFSFNNVNGEGIVFLRKFPKSPKEVAELAHELLHATFHVMNFCRVEYTYDGSNEAFTYLFEHLMRNAL